MSTVIASVDRRSPAQLAGIKPGEQLLTISQKKQIIQEQTKAAEELARKEKEILGTGDGVKPERIFCPNCGQPYDTPVKFCKKCGTKLQ